MTFGNYRIEYPYEGTCHVVDQDDGERVARVSIFLPGPMVSVTGPQITSPQLARAIAYCLREIADYVDEVGS